MVEGKGKYFNEYKNGQIYRPISLWYIILLLGLKKKGNNKMEYANDHI